MRRLCKRLLKNPAIHFVPAFVLFVLTPSVFAVNTGSFLQRIIVKRKLLPKESGPAGRACSVRDLEQKGEILDCEADGDQVWHGIECSLMSSSIDMVNEIKCIDGEWTVSGNTVPQTRRRRGILAGAVDIDQCLYFCQDHDQSNYFPIQPPIFTKCPAGDLLPVYYADKGERSTLVTWSPPIANSTHGSVEITQLSSPTNGGRFEGSTTGYQHRVLYEAVSQDGLKAFCQFDVTVKVRTCPIIPWPDNGHLVCSEGHIYGSMCTLQCRDGYTIRDNSTFTCEKDGNWTGEPSCLRINCPDPPSLLHGRVTCDDPNHSYQSVCSYTCDKGFALQGPIYSQCRADKTWSNEDQKACKDIEHPVLECLSPQILYADRGLLSTSVRWLEPSARDNFDQHPNITKIKGPSQGDTLPTGRTSVIYWATDKSGNISPTCSIELKVIEIPCEHPSRTFKDENIRFKCSDSALYCGVSCNLSCDYNLPLEGSATITCNKTVYDGVPAGTWVWESENLPYCKDVNCPTLDAPANGDFIPESLNGNPVFIMNCTGNYAIPDLGSSFNGHMYCQQGSWKPFKRAPDCVEPQKPGHMSLPAELYYYYSASCSETAIKDKLLTVISDIVHPLYTSICSNEIACSVEDVSVKCGHTAKRKKRDFTLDADSGYKDLNLAARRMKREETYFTVVEFDIITEWTADNMTVDEAFDFIDDLQLKQKTVFADLLVNGSLNIDGYTLRNDSFQTGKWGKFKCGSGMILDGVQCEPCPRGMFLNETSKKCQYCPVGLYQDSDGNTTCKRCPQGYSTLQTGSRHLQDCIKLCQPGYSSVTSMEPCTICPTGSYQESVGMTTCTVCPRDQTTSLPGSRNQTECQNFDVLIHGNVGDTVIGNITAVQNISISLWVKLLKKETVKPTTLQLVDGHGSLLSIIISSSISIKLNGTFDTGVRLTAEKWVHVTLVASDNVLEIYISGRKYISERAFLLAPTSGSFVLSADQSEGVLISGFQVINQSLAEDDVTALLSSCTVSVANRVIAMDAFTEIKHDGVVIVTPSICDAVDECASSPCGEHPCINEGADFRCICSNHMTGRFCETPPDYCSDNDCKKSSTCHSHETNYTCNCASGFSGMFCENEPENARWSDYGEWSSCSVSCDQGVRTRRRSCDWPPAVSGGQECVGESVETEPCHAGPCRVCKLLSQTTDVNFNCTSDEKTDLVQCHLNCSEGTAVPPGFKQSAYTCGLETNYEWLPFSNVPTCIAPVQPQVYGLDIMCGYSESTPLSAKDTVESKIKENLSETECLKDAQCEVSVNLENTMFAVSTTKITLKVALKSSNDPDIDGYISTGTMNAPLQEVVNAVVTLELTAAGITGNPSDICDVTVGSHLYQFNKSTLLVSTVVDCPDGSVPSEGLCVKCPVGTRAESGSCVFCDTITYQDELGQNVCKPCPSGFRTIVIGASDISECTEAIERLTEFSSTTTVAHETTDGTKKLPPVTSAVEPHTSSSTPTTDSLPDSTTSKRSTSPSTSESAKTNMPVPLGQDNTSAFGIGAIIGIVVGCLALMLSVFAVTSVAYRARTRKRKRQRDRGISFDNLYILRPERGPATNVIFGGHNRSTEVYDEIPPQP